MIRFIIRRALEAITTLLLLSTLTFFLLRLAPGGPFDSDRVWPPEIQANIEKRYGLDQPAWVQYRTWVEDLAHGDLHESFQYLGHPVTEILAQSFPVSFMLGVVSLFFGTLVGVILGGLAAWKRGTWIDSSGMFIAISGISLPPYLVASLLIVFFSLHLGWLPPALWESPGSAILPIVTLAVRPAAVTARLVRASMLDELSADYIRTALGKGLTKLRVIFKHALRNSLIPVIGQMGPLAANAVTGSFLVETVFQIPGMGKHFVQSILNRDYPLAMGVTLVYGIILLLNNILVDLAYHWADPRIRIEGSE